MNDDPSKVDVLYAKVSLTDGSDRYTAQHTLLTHSRRAISYNPNLSLKLQRGYFLRLMHSV